MASPHWRGPEPQDPWSAHSFALQWSECWGAACEFFPRYGLVCLPKGHISRFGFLAFYYQMYIIYVLSSCPNLAYRETVGNRCGSTAITQVQHIYTRLVILGAYKFYNSMMAQPPAERDSAGRPLLFVNKDASNLHITSSEAFAINSHVSSTHRNWMKSQRLKHPRHVESIGTPPGGASDQPTVLPKESESTSPPSWKPCRLLHYGPWPVTPDYEARKESKSNDCSASERSRDQKAKGNQEKLGAVEPDHGEKITVSKEKGDPILPVDSRQRPLSSSSDQKAPSHDAKRRKPPLLRPKFSSEPFAAAAIPMTPESRELISMAQRFHVFPAWPVKMSKVLRDEMTLSFQEHLSCAIADEGESHALLAAGCYSKALLYPQEKRRLLDRGLRHKIKTLVILRQRIQRFGGDYWNIFMLIRLLLALDFFAGDFEAARLHQSAAQRFMSQENLPPANVRRDILFISDVWLAVALMRHTEIHVGNWDPGPRRLQEFSDSLTQQQQQQISTTVSGSAVLPDPILRSLMDDIQELITTKALAQTLTDDQLHYQIVVWLHKRATALTGRLINHYTHISTTTQRRDPAGNSLLRVTLALGMALFLDIMFADVPSPSPHARVAGVFAVQVRKLWARLLLVRNSLSPSSSPLSPSPSSPSTDGDFEVDPDLMLWILFIGAFYTDSERKRSGTGVATDEKTSRARMDPSHIDTETDFHSWATDTIEFWFLPPAHSHPPPGSTPDRTTEHDHDHDPDALTMPALLSIKTKLKRFLYLDAQMDDYLARLIMEAAAPAGPGGSEEHERATTQTAGWTTSYRLDRAVMIEDRDGDIVFVDTGKGSRRQRERDG